MATTGDKSANPVRELVPNRGKELEDRLFLALLLNIDRLPQLKGAGRSRNPEVKSVAVRILAVALAEHLARQGTYCFRNRQCDYWEDR